MKASIKNKLKISLEPVDLKAMHGFDHGMVDDIFEMMQSSGNR